ncbi:hypothetical protein [Neptuniibacter marinus]|jgi:hypothetical protein
MPIEPADNSADAAAVALKQLYDQYGECAGRFYERLKGAANDDGR